MKPCSGQGLLQGGPIRPLPGLDFRVLVNDLPVAAVEVGFDAPSLRLNRTEGYSFLLSLVLLEISPSTSSERSSSSISRPLAACLNLSSWLC